MTYHAKWLRQASWLTAIGATLSMPAALRADDAGAAEEKAPAAAETPAAVKTPASAETPAAAAPAAKEPAAPKDPVAAKEVVGAKDAPTAKERVKRVQKLQIRVDGPKYRLGLHLMPVLPALNDQLDLKGEGLVVEHVMPDGPADKAGVKRHDILTGVGDKPVKSLQDLVDAENASDGKELSLKLLRGGKPVTVTATPTKPTEATEQFLFGKINPKIGVDAAEIEKLIREKVKQAGADVRMEFFKPGKIFPPGMFVKREDFPDDLTVNIHKQGKSPATVEVKKGDKTWNVKEDNLDELPDDVRPHVDGLLGRGQLPFTVRLGEDGPHWRHPEAPEIPHQARPAHPPRPPREHAEGRPPRRPDGPGPDDPPRERPRGEGDREPHARERGRATLEHRLEELSGRMQEMRRQMEQLRRDVREEREDDDE